MSPVREAGQSWEEGTGLRIALKDELGWVAYVWM